MTTAQSRVLRTKLRATLASKRISTKRWNAVCIAIAGYSDPNALWVAKELTDVLYDYAGKHADEIRGMAIKELLL